MILKPYVDVSYQPARDFLSNTMPVCCYIIESSMTCTYPTACSTFAPPIILAISAFRLAARRSSSGAHTSRTRSLRRTFGNSISRQDLIDFGFFSDAFAAHSHPIRFKFDLEIPPTVVVDPSDQGSKSRGSFSGARALDEKRSQRAWEFLKISQKTSGAAILKTPRKSWELPAFLGVFFYT